MSTLKTSFQKKHKSEIIVAAIGLFGVVFTAVVSNWEKINPPDNIVKSSFFGYTPTGDAEVELRYFFEITGARNLLKNMQKEMLKGFEQDINIRFKRNPELVAELMKAVAEESEGNFDQMMNIYVPIAVKFFSVSEIQELNKFYSTPAMREFTRKAPFLTKEFVPLAMPMVMKAGEQVEEKLNKIIEKYEKER